jgi:hypothetical protein
MCRYKSEGDPKGRSDCDSLRNDNALVHQTNEKLREEIRKLREERRWVPVSERLPEPGTIVIAFINGEVMEATFCGGNGLHWQTDRGGFHATHWQPLPPGPEGNGNG